MELADSLFFNTSKDGTSQVFPSFFLAAFLIQAVELNIPMVHTLSVGARKKKNIFVRGIATNSRTGHWVAFFLINLLTNLPPIKFQ